MASDAFNTWVERRLARERDRCAVMRVLGARGDLDRAVALVNESEAELQAAISEGIVRLCGGRVRCRPEHQSRSSALRAAAAASASREQSEACAEPGVSGR